jgi:aspartyl-tRNA(Asn)/glutamyl-tRNA(Gln) amidotransferase subunit A
MSGDIADLSATELLGHFRRRTLSPVEAARAALARIEAHNPTYNAFCFTAPEDTLAMARAAEARWIKGEPLGLVDGVPTAVKDQWPVKGWPNRRGSRTTSAAPAAEDCPPAQRLREHGAVFVGKTTTPEFSWKGVTDSPLTGISRNPWDPSKTCGGSSGGAAIAAALRMAALNLGSDGAGSIRMPCGFSGVFGLKPTYGRVPLYPAGAAPITSHNGPLTRTVDDAALMMSVITAPDARDWLGLPPHDFDYRAGLERGVGGLKIAYSATLGYANVDAEVAELVADAVTVFTALGAHVEARDPGFENPQDVFEMFFFTSMATALDGIPPEKRAEMDPGYVARAEAGRRFSGIDLIKGWAKRDALGRHMNLFHKEFDLLLTPSLPLAAFDAGLEFPPGRGYRSWFDWSPFHFPFNFTQQPAASVPCGFTRAGLPVALQIIGPRYREDIVLQAARAFETVRPFKMPQI